MGVKQRHPVHSLQQFLEIVGSKATECFDNQPHLIKYRALRRGNHGLAYIAEEKSTSLEVLHSYEALKEQWAHDPEQEIQALLQAVRSVGALHPQWYTEIQP